MKLFEALLTVLLCYSRFELLCFLKNCPQWRLVDSACCCWQQPDFIVVCVQSNTAFC